jgi:hypothetical protein
MKHMRIFFIMACLILATLTGCGVQPKATQESIAPSPTPQPTNNQFTAMPAEPIRTEIATPRSAVTPSTNTPPPPSTTAPTATSIPVTATMTFDPETAASSAADIIGTWRAKYIDDPILIIYYEDGTYGVKWPESNIWIARGNYQFQDTKLVLLDSHSGDACQTGFWNVYVTRQAGIPVRLRYELVQDTCEDRIKTYQNKTHTLVPGL